MNIEKEFIKKITSSYPGCEQAIYSLIERNALTTTNMRKYLIKSEYKEIIEKDGKIQKMIVYSDLAEKHHTSLDNIRLILYEY